MARLFNRFHSKMPVNIRFELDGVLYVGSIAALSQQREIQFLINLGGNLKFILRPSDGGWVTDNPEISQKFASAVGAQIESLEDLAFPSIPDFNPSDN